MSIRQRARHGSRTRRTIGRPTTGRRISLGLLAVWSLFAITVPMAADEPAAANEPADQGRPAAEEQRIELHRADRPSAPERKRMERWQERWRRQAEPLGRLLGGLGTQDQPPPVGRRSWCRALAEAVLAFDRERVFPTPSYAAGRSLRRGLDLLGRGAVACLQGRVYAASDLVRRAQRSFGDAAVLLRPYGVAP